MNDYKVVIQFNQNGKNLKEIILNSFITHLEIDDDLYE